MASLIQQSATFVASFVIGFVFYWKLALVMYITIPILSGMITLLAKVYNIMPLVIVIDWSQGIMAVN